MSNLSQELKRISNEVVLELNAAERKIKNLEKELEKERATAEFLRGRVNKYEEA